MALPPTKSAGAMERAGFTETPVTLMPTRCMPASVKPMARPAKPAALPGLVAPRMTVKKRKVATTSKISAAPRPYSPR